MVMMTHTGGIAAGDTRASTSSSITDMVTPQVAVMSITTRRGGVANTRTAIVSASRRALVGLNHVTMIAPGTRLITAGTAATTAMTSAALPTTTMNTISSLIIIIIAAEAILQGASAMGTPA